MPQQPFEALGFREGQGLFVEHYPCHKYSWEGPETLRRKTGKIAQIFKTILLTDVPHCGPGSEAERQGQEEVSIRVVRKSLDLTFWMHQIR